MQLISSSNLTCIWLAGLGMGWCWFLIQRPLLAWTVRACLTEIWGGYRLNLHVNLCQELHWPWVGRRKPLSGHGDGTRGEKACTLEVEKLEGTGTQLNMVLLQPCPVGPVLSYSSWIHVILVCQWIPKISFKMADDTYQELHIRSLQRKFLPGPLHSTWLPQTPTLGCLCPAACCSLSPPQCKQGCCGWSKSNDVRTDGGKYNEKVKGTLKYPTKHIQIPFGFYI